MQSRYSMLYKPECYIQGIADEFGSFDLDDTSYKIYFLQEKDAMQDLSETQNIRNSQNMNHSLYNDGLSGTVKASDFPFQQGQVRYITIIDGQNPPFDADLFSFQKNEIFFGRAGGDQTPDIELKSRIVSRNHGKITLKNGEWQIEDLNSTNGILHDGTYIQRSEITSGSIYRIDSKTKDLENSVLFLVSSNSLIRGWNAYEISKDRMIIGRDPSCDIVLSDLTVSRKHAAIQREGNSWFIEDLNSANGLLINAEKVTDRIQIHEKDVISILNAKIIFTLSHLYVCSFREGITVEANDLVVVRKNGRKKNVTTDHVSLKIKPGELISIIGGSGAGKSTLMNVLCGYLKPNEGNVLINGISLYDNFDEMKKIFGYVPQSDIVYGNLSLYDMLKYTAALRLPSDISPEERETAIQRAIDLVELTELKNHLIKRMSGGQRKRASIAVELLSDPRLLFLDEPASGLDPGTERSLMQSLRKMADAGKTIILVTHSTLQLHLCDKIVFMGRGGRLCFFGSKPEAERFFEVDDIVNVYQKITEAPEEWNRRFRLQNQEPNAVPGRASKTNNKPKYRVRQWAVLSRRYMRLMLNDPPRLLLLMAQAPLLAALISLVANGEQFKQYEMTKSLYFCLSCSGFWVGMLNAIQEICKERSILKREYMTGLSLGSYLLSKMLVLGFLCLIQSVLLTGVFSVLIGAPEKGVILPPILEIFITTWLTAVASAGMGLLVSSLFTNPDKAMTVAPLLLMPQMLFSGLLFKLSGATEIISWFAICRWSMEGYGTVANLNSLELSMQQKGIPIEHAAEDFFTYTAEHLWTAWGILAGFTVLFLILARISLIRIKREGN